MDNFEKLANTSDSFDMNENWLSYRPVCCNFGPVAVVVEVADNLDMLVLLRMIASDMSL